MTTPGPRPQRSSAAGVTLLVLAKAPCPGRSKTRLAPMYGASGAAALAGAALADTLDAVLAAPAVRRVLILDGLLPAGDVPAGVDVVPQAEGGHAHRIAAALAAVDGPALLIGMDTPQVTSRLLTPDPAAGRHQAWLGLAADGGWWALGFQEPARYAHPALDGIPMSTSHTGSAQHRRLQRLGLAVDLLPVLRDVDEPDDVPEVAALAPEGRFARLAAELGARAPRARATAR